MRNVIVGAMTYTVETPEAASVLESAATAWKQGDFPAASRYRQVALRIENGDYTALNDLDEDVALVA